MPPAGRDLDSHCRSLVATIAAATDAVPNGAVLRHAIEKELRSACEALGITWTPFHLERMSRRGRGTSVRCAGVAHGAVVIEYGPSKSFNGKPGGNLDHARGQAAECVDLLAEEEGRAQEEYVSATWDGAHISFGRRVGTTFYWESLQPFDASAAARLLGHLRDDGVPLVHPRLLAQRVGPDSQVGGRLLSALYAAVRLAESDRTQTGRTTRTQLLFFEWRRLFGQVVGVPSDTLAKHLEELSRAHEEPYTEDPTAYLFALNTYIALVAKLVAAMALPRAAQDICDPAVPTRQRMRRLESGELFHDAGVVNMLNGDFFSWYLDDPYWQRYESSIGDIVEVLRGVSFDVARKSPDSTRDLFKGLYMTFVPRALRHALGEYYTPDWLAAHALDTIEWRPEHSTLDPTCGSGTFLLEALRRRLGVADETDTAEMLLDGLYGLDLNPLAVLAARASIVVFLSNRLEPENPIRIPVYLADAVNPATASGDVYRHSVQTGRGVRNFALTRDLVHHADYFALMQRIRELVNDRKPATAIMSAIRHELVVMDLAADGVEHLSETVDTLVELKRNEWDGIWCSILADRFAAGAIPRVRAIVGNPPWVKWSQLPPEYAASIVGRCRELGVFSDDTWVGGIESDISTVIMYRALEKYSAMGGVLAFLITGTVFANESSQGFRRWRLAATATVDGKPEPMRVVAVEDYAAIAPFDGVTNHATLVILHRNGKPTEYPVPYRVWRSPVDASGPQRCFVDAEEFRSTAQVTSLLAQPVPGTDAGPWLKGTAAQHAVWTHLFGAQDAAYRARKGVTTDANGIFFLTAEPANEGLVRVANDPSLGRRSLPRVRTALIEDTHLFPLLRGEGVAAFRATVDPTYRVLVPQRGKDGDPSLPTDASRTYRFLRRFEEQLAQRSSYKRFQRRTGAPFWSLWSTGPYTFSPYKVVWKEMSGRRFVAAYVGSHDDPVLGNRPVIPDHKVYFVPCETEDEAAYLTAFLNAPLVSGAVAAYAAQLSLGVSVVEYLLIPRHDRDSAAHRELAEIAKTVTADEGVSTDAQRARLDRLVATLVGIPAADRLSWPPPC